MTQQNPPPVTTATPSPASTQTQASRPLVTLHPAPHTGFFGGIKRIFAFIGWVLTGFGLISAFRHRQSGRSRSEEIVVYTVHRSFYLWGLILIGFVGSFCVKHFDVAQGVWGWIYIFTLLYTIAALLFDVNTFRALLWGGIFALLWLSSKYLEDIEHMTILSGVSRYLRDLSPSLDPGTASVMSWMLLVPWIGSLFHSFTRGRKAFSPNSIEERFMGEGSEILDRSGLKFRTRYPDLFETFLGMGAGNIEAIDNSQHVVKEWDNVLFLYFLWPRLDEILHQRAAVVDNAPTDPVEVEEIKKPSSTQS